MSTETTKQQYIKAIDNPQFELWNSTSISHLMISIMGHDGYEVSDLAYQLYKKYINWRKELKNKNRDLNDFSEKVEKMYSYVKSSKEKGITDEELKEYVKKEIILKL